jgi:hypothetical protein
MKSRVRMIVLAAVIVITLATPAVAYALNWSPLTRFGAGDAHDADPEAARDGDGNVYVVWAQSPWYNTIRFNRYDSERGEWDGRELVHYAPSTAGPDVAVGPDGTVHVALSSGHQVHYTHRDDTGWISPVHVGIHENHNYPSIAVAPDGEIFLTGGGWVVHGDGSEWSDPERVLPTSQRTHLSVDNEGIVHIAGPASGTAAYRTWTGGAWSELTLMDGYSDGCGEVYMFHAKTGEADVLCRNGGRLIHWHRDENAWQEIDATNVRVGRRSDIDGSPDGKLATIWCRAELGNSRDCYVQLWNGSEWLEPDNATNSVRDSYWPGVVFPDEGTIMAISSERQGNWPYVLHSTIAKLPLTVLVDIKPGSDPNSVNPESKGVLPVAVLTDEEFEAAEVDPDSVLFEGAAPVRSTEEDVDSDGDADLVFHFKMEELELDENSTEATLTGATWDETPILGTDSVNVVPRGKGKSG